MGSGNYGWNYSKPDKPGYSDNLIGTVVAIQEVQKMGFTMNGQPGAPEFWPDGNPKMNIRLAVATAEGELKTFTFQPAGKAARMGQKPSVHMDLWHLTGDTDMMNLIGQTICIQTVEGHYGQGNPRPWHVSIMPEGYGPYELSTPLPAEFKAPQVLANAATSGGQVMSQQQPMQQPMPQQQWGQQPQQQWRPPVQQQPMPQQQWGQPQMQMPQWQQPPVQQQPQWQQPPMMQQQAQPAQQQYPNEMNRVIADAMQVFGNGVQVQQQPPMQSDAVGSGQVYDDDDDDMPF
jgi:hypothetical protein